MALAQNYRARVTGLGLWFQSPTILGKLPVASCLLCCDGNVHVLKFKMRSKHGFPTWLWFVGSALPNAWWTSTPPNEFETTWTKDKVLEKRHGTQGQHIKRRNCEPMQCQWYGVNTWCNIVQGNAAVKASIPMLTLMLGKVGKTQAAISACVWGS